ncbi:MAG: hypothetical protein ACI4I2_02045 [Oscillospiraceae bacterium]
MKKIILTIMSAVIFLTACKSIQPYTFDSINLEMSTIEVKEMLGEPSLEFPMTSEKGTDIYLIDYENQTVFGVDNAYVSIYIDESGVMSAYAQYQNQYVDNGSYLSEYNTIKENLISTLGKPQKIQEDADNFNYRCEWSNNFLTMEKLEDGNVKLWAYVIRSDHISEVTT